MLFEPIGFNWQISIALVPGLAAREVAVSALGTVKRETGGWTMPLVIALSLCAGLCRRVRHVSRRTDARVEMRC